VLYVYTSIRSPQPLLGVYLTERARLRMPHPKQEVTGGEPSVNIIRTAYTREMREHPPHLTSPQQPKDPTLPGPTSPHLTTASPRLTSSDLELPLVLALGITTALAFTPLALATVTHPTSTVPY
jgi:hypothetical protein